MARPVGLCSPQQQARPAGAEALCALGHGAHGGQAQDGGGRKRVGRALGKEAKKQGSRRAGAQTGGQEWQGGGHDRAQGQAARHARAIQDQNARASMTQAITRRHRSLGASRLSVCCVLRAACRTRGAYKASPELRRAQNRMLPSRRLAIRRVKQDGDEGMRMDAHSPARA